MIGYGQVFIRARGTDGRWGNHDVFDLTDYDFKRFVLTALVEGKQIFAVRHPTTGPGREEPLHSTKPTEEEIDE